jgi:hypothetical protein
MCKCDCKTHAPAETTTPERENARNELNLELYNLNVQLRLLNSQSQAAHEVQTKIDKVKERIKAS